IATGCAIGSTPVTSTSPSLSTYSRIRPSCWPKRASSSGERLSLASSATCRTSSGDSAMRGLLLLRAAERVDDRGQHPVLVLDARQLLQLAVVEPGAVAGEALVELDLAVVDDL